MIEAVLQVDPSFPWKELAGGGVGALMAAFSIWVIREIRTQHRESIETLKTMGSTFALTVEKQTAVFAESCQEQQAMFSGTTTKLVEDARVSHERREDRLHDLLREIGGGRPRT